MIHRIPTWVLLASVCLAACNPATPEERRLQDLAESSPELMIRSLACSRLPAPRRPKSCHATGQQWLKHLLAKEPGINTCHDLVSGVLIAPDSPEATAAHKTCCSTPEDRERHAELCEL